MSFLSWDILYSKIKKYCYWHCFPMSNENNTNGRWTLCQGKNATCNWQKVYHWFVTNTMVKLTFNFCEQQRSVSNQSEGQMKPRQAFSQMGVQDGHFLKEFDLFFICCLINCPFEQAWKHILDRHFSNSGLKAEPRTTWFEATYYFHTALLLLLKLIGLSMHW